MCNTAALTPEHLNTWTLTPEESAAVDGVGFPSIYIGRIVIVGFVDFTVVTMKNTVFCEDTTCGS
jgi:hypothetical protein